MASSVLHCLSAHVGTNLVFTVDNTVIPPVASIFIRSSSLVLVLVHILRWDTEPVSFLNVVQNVVQTLFWCLYLNIIVRIDEVRTFRNPRMIQFSF